MINRHFDTPHHFDTSLRQKNRQFDTFRKSIISTRQKSSLWHVRLDSTGQSDWFLNVSKWLIFARVEISEFLDVTIWRIFVEVKCRSDVSKRSFLVLFLVSKWRVPLSHLILTTQITASARIGGTPLDELDDINFRLTKLVKAKLRKCKRFNHFVNLRDVTMRNFARAFIRVRYF